MAESGDRRGMAAAQTEVTEGSESDLVDAPGRARDHPVVDIAPTVRNREMETPPMGTIL